MTQPGILCPDTLMREIIHCEGVELFQNIVSLEILQILELEEFREIHSPSLFFFCVAAPSEGQSFGFQGIRELDETIEGRLQIRELRLMEMEQ